MLIVVCIAYIVLQDSHIPPSERCAYRTTKAPTGPYNRKHLIDFLEKKAKEEKDWDEAKPYAKEVRGKSNCSLFLIFIILICIWGVHLHVKRNTAKTITLEQAKIRQFRASCFSRHLIRPSYHGIL